MADVENILYDDEISGGIVDTPKEQQVKIWHNDDDDDDDEIFEWYEGYEKRKAQKLKIKEELLPTPWHPSRWWDWCMSKDKEKNRNVVGIIWVFCAW